MEEGSEDNAKHKRLSIQKKANKKVNRKICGTIHDRRSSIKKYSKAETTNFYEDSPGS